MTRLRDRTGDVLDHQNRAGRFAGQAYDIQNLPGFAQNLHFFNKAMENQQGERTGRGLLGIGTPNQSPEIAARILEQQNAERQQAAAGQLEGAANEIYGQANQTASALGLAGESRAQRLAEMGQRGFQDSQGTYLQYLMRPRQPSIWGQLLQGGLSAAAGLATGGASTALGAAAGGAGFHPRP